MPANPPRRGARIRVGPVSSGDVGRGCGVGLGHLEPRQGRADALRVRLHRVGERLQPRLGLGDDRLLVVRVVERELRVSRPPAVLRAGERGVRAALAVGEDRGAAAGEVLRAWLAAAEGSLRLGLRELGVALDVDLPAGEARGEAGVHTLLADRERQLVVRGDDGRLARLVVEVDLAHARRRECLRDEAGRFGVPRDDVDLLAPQLRHDHADTRAARADARADRIDALGVRLDRDLRAVAGLAGHAANLDETIRDLRHLELEQRLDQLRIAPREDDLRAFRPGAHLGDDRLDPRPLLVALAVDLLGARQQRLDLAEVDEDVVAVAGLLDDTGHDLGHAVDVLVVHHPPLLLANPLQNDLFCGLRGDASEALRSHVLPLDVLVRNVGPVDVEVVVGDERVLALAGLLLEPLELLELALSGLVEQTHLDVGRQLDREDAEVAGVVVHLDGRMTRRARRLLVGREERVLERGDERALVESLVALDLANGLDDLLAHVTLPHQSDLLARSPGTESRSPRRRRRRPSRSARLPRGLLRGAFARPCEAGPGGRAPPRSAPAGATDGRGPVRTLRRCTRAGTRAGRR